MSFISVVIPTRGRPAALRRCLASLATQTQPRHTFEVVVVDDGGAPPVDPSVIGTLGSALDLRVLRTRPAGPAAARSHGIGAARGDVLVLLEDDCTVPHDYLARVDLIFRTQPDTAVAQVRLAHAEAGTSYGRVAVVAIETALRANTWRQADGRLVSRVLGGTHVIRRAAVEATALEPALAHARPDADLRLRLREAAIRVYYEPALVVRCHGPATLPAFVAQHFAHGRAEAQLRRRWGGAATEGVRTPRLTSLRMLRRRLTDEGLRQGLAVHGLLWLRRRAGIWGFLFERDALARPGGTGPRVPRVAVQWLGWEARQAGRRLRRALRPARRRRPGATTT